MSVYVYVQASACVFTEEWNIVSNCEGYKLFSYVLF